MAELNSIQLNNLLPIPLKDSPESGEIWRKQLELLSGNKYLIVADSGKGKSTLLNIIYGIRRDYSGNLTINGMDVKLCNPALLTQWRNEKLAYLFQDLRLFGDLTARENIHLKPGCNYTNAEIELAAEKLGVAGHLDKPCKQLSLGQQQRIAIIRLLSQRAEWLMLDEPFSHLDDRNAELAMHLILEKAEQSGAGIISTSLGNNKHFEMFNTVAL